MTITLPAKTLDTMSKEELSLLLFFGNSSSGLWWSS